MRKRKKSCSRRMPSDALAHWNGLPVPLGAAGRPVLLQYYPGKYGAQVQALLKKTSRWRSSDLPAPWSRAYRRAGGVSAAL